jgi:hypothetical protein
MFVVVLKQHFSSLDFQVGEVGSALLLLQNSLGVAGKPCNCDFYYLHVSDNLSHMLVTTSIFRCFFCLCFCQHSLQNKLSHL